MRRRNNPLDSTVLSEGRNRTKAQVRLVRLDGETVVEKDYSARGLLIRHLLGPRLLDREERALEQLADVRGVPGLRARPSRDRLLMERLPGRPLSSFVETPTGSGLPPDFFLRLRRLVKRVHGEGVTQGDIGTGDVLVLTDGSPGLVDFAVSVQLHGGPLNPWLFRTAVHQDLRRIARLHQRYSPANLDADEERILSDETTTHRWSRRLRDLVPGRRRA
jgi:RIO-like serine/threonine protein kinase